MRLLLMLPAVAFTTTGVAGETAGAGHGICLESRAINGWSVINDRQIQVTIGANRRYLLSLALASETAGFRSIAQIGFRPDNSGNLCARTGFVIADGRAIRIDSIQLLP
jgi:hypothetical protein